MGELEAATTVEPAQKLVFDGFKEQSSGHRISTESTMLNIIRAAHPEMHVTRTSPTRCDLLGYAEAGLATSIKGDDEYYDYTRQYQSPGPRIEKRQATLQDIVVFAQWQYTWQNHSFLLYQIKYTDPHSVPLTTFFILSPKSLVDEGAVPPTDRLLLTVGAWSADLHSEIYVFDDGRWVKNKELWKSVQDSSWDDVILNAEMKANLISDVQGFFDNQTLYKSLAVPWKRGLILHGVPGNGKTISIKALISSLSSREDPIPSLYVKSFDACQGEKYSIRSIFQRARHMAPCLLIFEDLDSLITDKTRSYFLNEVDGLESNDGILMIGSTNHLETLDPAISKRPSRFDRKYHFKIPDEGERLLYARFWRSKLLDNDLVDFPEELCHIIGKLSKGFSFAYLKELFVVTLLTIARGSFIEEEAKGTSASGNTSEENSNVPDTSLPVGSDTIAVPEGNAQHAIIPAVLKPKLLSPRRIIPEVDTPDHLKDNVLLRVIRSEIKNLLAEMDSTQEGEWPSEKKQVGGGGSSNHPIKMRYAQAMPMMDM